VLNSTRWNSWGYFVIFCSVDKCSHLSISDKSHQRLDAPFSLKFWERHVKPGSIESQEAKGRKKEKVNCQQNSKRQLFRATISHKRTCHKKRKRTVVLNVYKQRKPEREMSLAWVEGVMVGMQRSETLARSWVTIPLVTVGSMLPHSIILLVHLQGSENHSKTGEMIQFTQLPTTNCS
jgi:hypothetical protein